MDPGALRPPWADTRQINNYHRSLSRPDQHPARLYAGTAKRKKKRRPRRESRNEKRDAPRNEKKRRPETKKRDKRTPGLVHASCRICEIAEPRKGSNARQVRHVTVRTQNETQRVHGSRDARPIAGQLNVMMFIMAWDPADCRQLCKF